MDSEQSNTGLLTVKSVLDKRRPIGFQLIDADIWLKSLSEVGYAELRAITTHHGNDIPQIVCAECEWPVYSPDVGGKRRFFQHRKGFPKTCCYSGKEGKDPRQVDADKFGGMQEGDRHKELKTILCEVLSFSEVAKDISQERHVSLPDGTFARPDVYVGEWLKAPLAFDIQLSTTQIPTITRREAFYKRGGARYMWITAVDQEQLLRRAFRDIYMRNDGHIFGIDEEVLQEARKQRKTLFRVYRLVPGKPEIGFKPEFKDKIVPIEGINWGDPGSLPCRKPSYDELVEWQCEHDPLIQENRSKFYNALVEGKRDEAGAVWNRVQSYVGGMTWDKIPARSWDTIPALGVLATLATGKLCVHTKINKDNEASLVNTLLLEPKGRRPFGELLEQLLQATKRHELLNKFKVREKLERAIAETMDISLAKNIGPVYDAFISQGAFRRLILNSAR